MDRYYVRMKDSVVCAIAGCDSLISNGHSRYCKAHQVYRIKNRYRLTDPLPEKQAAQ